MSNIFHSLDLSSLQRHDRLQKRLQTVRQNKENLDDDTRRLQLDQMRRLEVGPFVADCDVSHDRACKDIYQNVQKLAFSPSCKQNFTQTSNMIRDVMNTTEELNTLTGMFPHINVPASPTASECRVIIVEESRVPAAVSGYLDKYN